MGLDTSHDCFHGAYSAFSRFRLALAAAAKIPLKLMEGYYEWPGWILDTLPKTQREIMSGLFAALPLSWELFEGDPLVVLLHHSDCDGTIPLEHCAALAKRLRELAPLLRGQNGGGHMGDIRAAALRFAEGLELAASKGEDVRFS